MSIAARNNPLNDFGAPYADLPDEVLQQVLGRTAEVADAVRTLFTRVDERRDRMRTALQEAGRLQRVADLAATPLAASIAAVDGGAAIEKALGADTALAVAVGIEGLTDAPVAHWTGIQYAAWQKTLPHEGEETAITCRGVMTALELSVLREAPHDVLLLDGAHLTPVIALNSLLSVKHEALREEIATVVTKYDTANALRDVMRQPAVVAVVKYDASRDLSQTYLPSDARGPGLGLDDRTTMSLLLEAGEFTTPHPVALTQESKNNWIAKHIEAITPADAAREEVRLAVNDAVTIARSDQLLVTYFKPHVWSPAFRLEIKPAVAEDPEYLAAVLNAVRGQVVSPEIREPYPQWVADRMAKSVGDALVALRTAVNYDLADAGLGEYVSLLAHSYRTEAF